MSGIRPSDELLSAFSAARDGNVRFLKVQIDGSAMVVKHTKSLDENANEQSDFAAVDGVLEDNEPCYILFKMDSNTKEGWLLANWVPENTQVRKKMLYASSRETLKKELGAASITAEIIATERDEISYESYQSAVVVNEAERLSLMSDTERALKQTANTHVDTGIPAKASYVHGVKFPIADDARDAIAGLSSDSTLSFIQLAVVKDPKEQIVLDKKATVEAGFAAYKNAVFDTTEPRFSFYSAPGEGEGLVVFCLYCPEECPVKQKMLYSTAKSALTEVALELGVNIAIKLEVREPSDLAESDLVPSAAAAEATPQLPTKPRGPGGGRGMIKLPGM